MKPWTRQQKSLWVDWVLSRPKVIQEMCKKWPPNKLYRMSSGHRCTINSYYEDGTVKVNVTGEYNLVGFSRSVFGVDPKTLVPCEPPGPDEPVGDVSEELGLTEKEIRELIVPLIKKKYSKTDLGNLV